MVLVKVLIHVWLCSVVRIILLIGFVTTEDNVTSILIFVTLKPLDFGVGRKHSSTTQSRIGFGNVKVCLEILRFD